MKGEKTWLTVASCVVQETVGCTSSDQRHAPKELSSLNLEGNAVGTEFTDSAMAMANGM